MIKVVIVGFGFMGRTHAGEILDSSNLKLIAIVDENIDEILQRLNEEKGNLNIGSISAEMIQGTKLYHSLEECLEHEKPDSVHICVHTNMHYELAIMAMRKGINVLIEKPLCLDLKQGRDLIRITKETGLIMMVGHVVRFMPAYRQLKEWINNNQFGRLEFLYMTRVSGIPLWGQWRTKQTDFGSSGGALFDLLIHDIDFVIYALGKPPDEIRSTYLPGNLSNHDYISADWKYSDKKIHIRIEGGNTFHSAFPFRAGFIARFEKASVSYSTNKPEILIIADHDQIQTIDAGKPEHGFSNEIKYFYECIQNSAQPYECMPEDSLETLKTCYRHLLR